jgi:hypothetical protein
MLEKIAKKFVKQNLKPFLNTLVSGLKKYKNSINLENDEKSAVGLITFKNDEIYIYVCTAKQVDDQLQTVRQINKWSLSELSSLLENNLDNLDLSELITKK